MIAVDTNLLVYAHRGDSAFHTEAADILRSLAEGRGPWAIPWPCVHEFMAISTHPRIYDPPSSPEQAIGQLDAWLESPSLRVIGEGTGYERHLKEVVRGARSRGGQVHDARIAAICLYHAVDELWSADRDFSRFPTLRTRNPLVAGD